MSTFLERYPDIAPDLKRIREIILENIDNSGPTLRGPLTELASHGGKMLRPAFLVLFAGFGQKRGDNIYHLAAAVEMLHMATLIHDDVIDGAGQRRGIPSLNAKYGNRLAVLMGDYLFSRCFVLASRFASPQNSPLLAHAVARICESEIAQASQIYNSQVTKRDYLRRIAGKTTALFLLSCHTGATESRAASWITALARSAGYCIGSAFQIIDDILDYNSQDSVLGKPVGNDLKEGIYTLPLICALEKDDKGSLRGMLSESPFNEDQIKRIISETDRLGGIQKAQDIAATYTGRARKFIGMLPGKQEKKILTDLTGDLLARVF